MTCNAAAGPREQAASFKRGQARAALLWWLVAVALMAIAIVLRTQVAANTDVSWLLTAGERVLAGRQLYVDIIETNPPMAVLAYMPGIVLARALHLPVEMVTDALVFALMLLSLAVTAVCLRRSSVLDGVNGALLGVLAIAILAIAPMYSFGQREHIALIELLPLLAIFAVRAQREAPSGSAIAIAGVAAGLSLCFKPHFAVAVLFGVGALALHLRSWRAFVLPEVLVAGAIKVIYVGCILVFFPEFLTVIGPLVRDVYLAVALSPLELLLKPGVLIWFSAVFAALMLARQRATRIDPVLRIIAATSMGFAIVFALQRKGWPYHTYPMIALALIGLSWSLASTCQPTTRVRVTRSAAIMVFAAAFAGSLLWFNLAFYARSLQASVAKLGPHPRILALTAEPALGHPLVRALDGVWVSRQQAIWVAGYLRRMKQRGQLDPAGEAALNVYAVREREMLIADITRTPPTVVLLDNLTGDWSAWLRSNPEVADLLKDYRVVDSLNGVYLLARPR